MSSKDKEAILVFWLGLKTSDQKKASLNPACHILDGKYFSHCGYNIGKAINIFQFY